MVPVPLADPTLAGVVKAVKVDPFGAVEALLGLQDVPAHLCATAWVLDPKRRRTLLCRHRILGWSVPGGHLEPDEPPGQGALRELHEETGLVGRLLLADPCFVHMSIIAGERPHRHWNLAYAVEADADLPLLLERDEAAWFELHAVPTEAPDDLTPGLAVILSLVGTA